MSNDVLAIGLILVVAVVTLNLWLTFRLFALIRHQQMQQSQQVEAREVGAPVPQVNGHILATNAAIDSNDYNQYAKVLVYLSSECPKCKSKLPELERTLLSIGDAGVVIWLLSDEPDTQIKRFFNTSELQHAVLKVSAQTYLQINPQRASPYYQFIDQDNVLQAQGFIGDDNWQQFCRQLAEAA